MGHDIMEKEKRETTRRNIPFLVSKLTNQKTASNLGGLESSWTLLGPKIGQNGLFVPMVGLYVKGMWSVFSLVLIGLVLGTTKALLAEK